MGRWGPLSAAALIAVNLTHPVHLHDAAARAAIETAITLFALIGACLLASRFERSRRREDLLILGALAAVSVADLAFSALPAITGWHATIPTSAARLACQLLVAMTFCAAALAPAGKLIGGGRKPVVAVGLGCIGTVVLAELSGLLIGAPTRAALRDGLSVVAGHQDPRQLVVALVSSGLLLVAALAFIAQSDSLGRRTGLLAGAALLLTVARLQYLSMSTVSLSWVTLGDGARVAAYGLLLIFAVSEHAKTREEQFQVALSAERERIARDLHDGLAQDLAFIAMHAPRLVSGPREEHPLIVASRRALAASRGAIVDLSASRAATTSAALREVAEELEARFSVEVHVEIAENLAAAEDLTGADREAVVRIAREAIVNAVKHGAAKHIDVMLDCSPSGVVLRVVDDGSGIADKPGLSAHGFGLPTMRARARALGGELHTRKRRQGGTEVELLVS